MLFLFCLFRCGRHRPTGAEIVDDVVFRAFVGLLVAALFMTYPWLSLWVSLAVLGAAEKQRRAKAGFRVPPAPTPDDARHAQWSDRR